MTPDLELLTVTALLDSQDLAALVGDRIGTRTPRTLDEPWIKVTLIDDRPDPTSSALHLVAGLVQLDCYGSSDTNAAQGEASLIARTARSVLHRLAYEPQATGTVVSRVKPGGLRRLPDTGLEPARERYVLDVEISAHHG